MIHGSVFTGIGLLDYGLMLAGLGEPAWVCEQDEWRRSILAKRFPGAVQHADVRDLGAANARRVDLVAGGFPCKGASTAGKRTGFDHPETVLWREMFRVVRELRPRYVLVENVANLLALHDGAVWGEVVGDLAAVGFDIEWDCIPAAAVGAPHLRDRVFAVATHPDPGRGRAGAEQPAGLPGDGQSEPGRGGADASDAASARRQGARPGREGLGGAAAGDPATAPDPDGGRFPQQPQRDSKQRRRVDGPLGNDAVGSGVRVEWGDYGPAVRRWEQVHGAAPEPLLRGVDARAARRVVRSRLSALGDGVQVQVAEIAGRYIVEREAERMRAAA